MERGIVVFYFRRLRRREDCESPVRCLELSAVVEEQPWILAFSRG